MVEGLIASARHVPVSSPVVVAGSQENICSDKGIYETLPGVAVDLRTSIASSAETDLLLICF